MKREDITVLIHTFNEEKHLQACINSARLLSDTLIVVDMESKDDTAGIAMKNNVTVFTFPPQSYVEPARQFGIEKVKTRWVFILDADERITKELADEILSLNPSDSIYKVPRKEYYAEKVWLKHGGWWPNSQFRLLNKDQFIKWPPQIHSTPEFKGTIGYLKESLLHFSKNDLSEMVKKTLVFENKESDLLFKANKSVNTLMFFRKYFGELFRRLIKNKGFMDGTYGVIESMYQAFSKTITYLFLYEKKLKKNRDL